MQCRNEIAGKHNIPAEEKILLFNGLLNYKPNWDALKNILENINPLLIKNENFKYKIVICGKGLPDEMNNLKSYADKNIIFAGFVDDITIYFKAADIMLNPVQSGGGVKTKMVEAIAFGATVIATETGAAGIDRSVCGNKLTIVEDNDWESFVNRIMHTETKEATPSGFYALYNWDNIIKKIKVSL